MIAAVEQTKSTSLYFRQGSSDKEYHVYLEAKDDGFVVNFAFGRRGSTLSTGTKTSSPVEYEAAEKIFDKLVKEKKAKGYTEGADGTPYRHSEQANQVSGILPQLLNSIEEAAVLDLIQHPGHCAQEKFDGRRLLVRKEGPAINGINRKGNLVGLPEALFQVIRQFDADVVLDGESIGDYYHAFDLLILDGVDIRYWPYRERLTALMNLLFSIQQTVIKFAETAFTVEEKLRLLKELRQANKEGIVFKQLDAPYTPGRPNSGGSQLKHKFYATLSAVVAGINTQRSVSLRLLNHEGWIPVGNVTIPPNHRIPKVGAVVEVRYLYAFKDGSLYQPVYQGVRNDVEQTECVVSQLKYKPEEEE